MSKTQVDEERSHEIEDEEPSGPLQKKPTGSFLCCVVGATLLLFPVTSSSPLTFDFSLRIIPFIAFAIVAASTLALIRPAEQYLWGIVVVAFSTGLLIWAYSISSGPSSGTGSGLQFAGAFLSVIGGILAIGGL